MPRAPVGKPIDSRWRVVAERLRGMEKVESCAVDAVNRVPTLHKPALIPYGIYAGIVPVVLIPLSMPAMGLDAIASLSLFLCALSLLLLIALGTAHARLLRRRGEGAAESALASSAWALAMFACIILGLLAGLFPLARMRLAEAHQLSRQNLTKHGFFRTLSEIERNAMEEGQTPESLAELLAGGELSSGLLVPSAIDSSDPRLAAVMSASLKLASLPLSKEIRDSIEENAEFRYFPLGQRIAGKDQSLLVLVSKRPFAGKNFLFGFLSGDIEMVSAASYAKRLQACSNARVAAGRTPIRFPD